jgi:hypothetical protein
VKTDDLISLLAADTAPALGRRSAARQIAIAVGAGIALAALMMQLTLGVRPDLGQAIVWPMFWMKVLFPAMVAVASFATLARLARPGVSASAAGVAIAVPVLLLWWMAMAAYAAAPPPERAAMVWGQTWRMCVLNIVLIAAPIFVATCLALRQLAPTRLALSGACAGALSGAAGAAVYAFHCPETALPFMAIWYVAGIGLTALIGAGLGRRILRW